MELGEGFSSQDKYKIAAFYCFIPFTEELILSLIDDLRSVADDYNLKGTVLIAFEGFNGTICGSNDGVSAFLGILNTLLSADSLEVKISWSNKQAFRRFRLRRKAEIVTMGVKEVNPLKTVGKYVKPSDWNDFVDDPSTIVIDTRNEYEISIGSFEGAINPHTQRFRDFPAWADSYLAPLIEKVKPARIGMFCTGGIRCEKATSYLNRKGFQDVYHLEGGILRYLEEIPKHQSRWSGECYVFDQRVALDHYLRQGTHSLCHACGLPLNPEDLKKPSYVPGVQCYQCLDKFSDKDRIRFAERQRQMEK
ncbi:rhodanese-related sulfurtransferase [Prochlorococcus sp. MIT 1300]|uniref:oxygen-dependent tRNA uridine(34) hydroxylase TrhO n=1 Tax=Prochlorococcus sp. MIT 1300 TaxID=3096218 RepID=UPI002A762FC4|nr:rhodanese-related sulfurtransferase [Prochlorococcus sp. MIT 1300]